MAVIQMPARKGENETGMITKWHKKTGDWVAEGDELFSFDTDDGTFTVKSQKAGRLVAVFVPEGEIVQCPADVGMLTSPTPDSVLKLGRQQFIDETKPAEAREPVQETAEENNSDETEEAAEAAEVPKEEEAAAEAVPEAVEDEPAEEAVEAESAEDAPEADEAEFSEEELLEYVEDDLTEVEKMDEAEEENVEEEENEEAIVSEEELLQYVEEDVTELEAMDEAEEDAEEAPEEEAFEAEEAKASAAAKPASVTAQADMTLCMDIAERTGVKLGAMVRFAAMHTGLKEHLEVVEAEGLRALDAAEKLPNVRDLSETGITMVSACCASGVELLVPAVHEAWRVNNDALEVYPCLNLTLAFDENAMSVEEAAKELKETCEKLENLIELLI